MDLTSILAIIVLVLVIYAIIMILKTSETLIKKILWIALLIVLPLIGFIIWYFVGPGKKPF